MASTDRRSSRDLIAEIREQGPRFRFFQAVRLLALCEGKHGSQLPIPCALRFGTPLSLAFPASEIMCVQANLDATHTSDTSAAGGVHSGGNAADHALHPSLMTVGFMGLTGPSGVMPTCYTELLIERRNAHRDTSAHVFFDLFTHRAVSLFYEVWRKHRFYVAYEAGDRGSFTRNLLDLIGMGLLPLQSRLQSGFGGIPDMFLIHFAGLLSQRPVSAMNLSALLRGYFRIDAEIEQFVGRWIPVPGEEQTCLGTRSCILGDSAFLGERIWDRQTKIRIRLGPLARDRFSDFLPGQTGAEALAELMRFCVGHSLACDVRLDLHKDFIAMPRLMDGQAQAPRLGYNVWLHTHAPCRHSGDAHFALLN